MKNLFKLFLCSGLFSLALSSCMSEEPFQSESGNNLVRMSVSMNTATTRAIEEESLQSLLDNCVIYISDEGGLLHTWVGVDNIPSRGVYLKYGDYLAEAWSGDSVPASFSKKFYKGETKFAIGQENVTTQVNVNCRIANVVTCVETAYFPTNLVRNLKATVTNAGNSLIFAEDSLLSKGYFMRPFDKESGTYDSRLSYTVSGIDVDGSEFSASGEISNALPGHEYRLMLVNHPQNGSEGGIHLEIEVQDYELYQDEDALIFGPPQFAWEGSSADVSSPITRSGDSFESHSLLIGAADGFKSITINTNNEALINNFAGNSEIEIIGISSAGVNSLAVKGIEIVSSIDGAIRTKGYRLTFSADWFEALPKGDEPLIFTVKAVDLSGKSNTAVISILNTDSPFVIDTNIWDSDFMSILTTSAKVSFNILDADKDLGQLKLQYREEGKDDWMEQNIVSTQKLENYSSELKGLSPATRYEVRVVGGLESEGNYQFYSPIAVFETETPYEIPNKGMEDWWQDGNVWMPNSQSAKPQTWDTGNHGSALLGGKTLTNKNSTIKSSGEYSACLQSQFVGFGSSLGKFAAGNLFIGTYIDRVGTSGAKLNFGQPYNGSHPKKLRVQVHYRPSTVDYVDSKLPDSSFQKGQIDYGQIYIAIASAQHYIDTSIGTMFDPQSNIILGYGEQTFKEDVGPEGGMATIEIPINYYDRASFTKASHLIIVCSASKYGDYFTGSSKSVMYLDDFELIYE